MNRDLIPTPALLVDAERVEANLTRVVGYAASHGLTWKSHLRDGPTVYRCREDDGLPGLEGGFHLRTSWLIDSYLLIGRVDEARALFQSVLGLAGPQGLLSEEYDPRSGRALGNYPQAYSHIGLIRNALALEAGDGKSQRKAS